MNQSLSALQVKNLSKKFGDLEVLKDVSLEANRHDVISILGSSGSGKSTLLRCINLLESPSSGEVYVDDELIRMKALKNGERIAADNAQISRIRSRLAMVFQQFNLWSFKTALENVMEAPMVVLGLPKSEARERAEAMLEKVGLEDRHSYYPSHLSGGQQQRVAIARSLAMDPNVILFDEPTSSLDPERVGEVLKVIRDLADEGRTMLVVTHEVAFAREISNKVMFLHQGISEEFGDTREVFDNPKSARFKQFLSANLK